MLKALKYRSRLGLALTNTANIRFSTLTNALLKLKTKYPVHIGGLNIHKLGEKVRALKTLEQLLYDVATRCGIRDLEASYGIVAIIKFRAWRNGFNDSSIKSRNLNKQPKNL